VRGDNDEYKEEAEAKAYYTPEPVWQDLRYEDLAGNEEEG